MMHRRIRRLRPIVIGGCARSGTTLLLSILSSHRDIAAIPHETQLLCPGAYWPTTGSIASPNIEKLNSELTKPDFPATTLAWCEKTPRNVYNFEAIIDDLGDSARLIHLVRDGRDVVLSRHPEAPDQYWVSPDRWLNDVRAGLRLRHHPQVLTIRYEDLVTDLPHSCRILCEFLGLDLDERCEQYPQFALVSKSNAWFEPACRVHTSSIGRWKLQQNAVRVQQLLDHPDAAALLKELGYGE